MLSIFTDFLELPERDIPEEGDALTKLFDSTALEAAGIDGDKLEREMAHHHQHAAGIYQKIAAAQTPTRTLEKNASASTKLLRTEITKYSDGSSVIAEIGMDGTCLRTYRKDAA